MLKENNLILSKMYLFIYVLSFSIVILFQDTLWNTLKIPHLIYVIGLFLGIIVNSLLTMLVGINRNDKIRLFILVILLLISIIPLFYGYKTLSPILLMVLLMILNANIIQPLHFIKIDFIMRIILVSSIILMFFLNVFSSPDIVFRGSKIRYGLGFEHPNVLGFNILSILFSYVLLKNNYKKYINSILSVLLLILICGSMSYITGSRELEISSYSLIIFYLLYNSIKSKKILRYISNIFVVPLCTLILFAALSFALDPNIDIPFFYWINKISSNRLVLQAQALQFYPIKLFGYISTPLLREGSNPINIDNFYVAILIHCGILGFLVFICFLLKIIIDSIKNGSYITNIVLIIVCISLVTCYTNDFYTPLIYIASLSSYNELNK